MIYAVNKRTKEHRIHTPGHPSSPEEEFVEATPDGWIEWPGGECPLPEGAKYDAKLYSGKVLPNCEVGINIKWDCVFEYRPITWDCVFECRPILETKPEPPAWDGDVPPVGAYVEYPTGRGVVKLPPDRDGVTVVEDDGSKFADEAGTYKRVAARVCHPIRSEEGRAIEAMRNATSGKDDDANFYKAIYRAIRDGKVPGVKLAAADGEEV